MQTPEQVTEVKNLYTALETNLNIIKSLEIMIERLLDSNEEGHMNITINAPKHIKSDLEKGRMYYAFDDKGPVSLPPGLAEILNQFSMPDFKFYISSPLQVKFTVALINILKEENNIINQKIEGLK